MSNIFLSYRFTGEDPKELDFVLGNIKSSLEKAGHNVLCSYHWEDYFQSNKMSLNQIYEYCLKKQEEADTLMALLKSEDRSQGMLKELRKAKELGQRYVLLEKEGVYVPEFRDMAGRIITFDGYRSLFSELENFK